MDGSVDGSVELCAVLRYFGGGFNDELVDEVVFLLEINVVKVGEEATVLS